MFKSVFGGVILMLAYISTAFAVVNVPVTTYIKIIDYGIYEGDVISKIQSDNPMGYRIVSKMNDLVSSTDKIPAKVGTRFGFRFEIAGQTLEKYLILTRVIKTPRITNPQNGKSTDVFRDVIRIPVGDLSLAGYLFEYEWELVPGECTIQLYDNNRLLAEKTFLIYKP